MWSNESSGMIKLNVNFNVLETVIKVKSIMYRTIH